MLKFKNRFRSNGTHVFDSVLVANVVRPFDGIVHVPAPIIFRVRTGDSARDTALPWDTIQTTRFRAGEPLDNTIDSLTVSHIERAKDDPNVQYLEQFIANDRELRERKTVSLNIETRREERAASMDRALELENNRRAALGLEALESLEDLDEDDRPDIQLDQAAGIVTDLAVMREVAGIPAQTAQVSP